MDTNLNTQDLIQLGSVLVALVAVVVGPLVTLRTSKHQSEATRASADIQARANVLSANRQAWINELRLEVAGFLSIATMFSAGFAREKDGPGIVSLAKDLTLHLNRTQLLINPKEADHAALFDKMLDLAAMALKGNRETSDIPNEIASLAQSVLKREWERVKTFT